MSEQEKNDHWLESLRELEKPSQYIVPLTERLHHSSGIRSPYGHAEKVLIRHTEIKLQPSNNQLIRQYHDALRNLGKTGITDIQERCGIRYSKSLPDPDECQYLVKLFDRHGQIKTLLHDDIQRKAWFLHLCRRTWETSGHWVLGVAQTARGRDGLEVNSGIPTILFSNLSKVLNPGEILNSLKQSSQRELGDIGSDSPFPVNERTVLIVNSADRLNASHLAFLMEAAQLSKAKLILLESSKPSLGRHRTPFFHIHEHLEKLLEQDRKRYPHRIKQIDEMGRKRTSELAKERDHDYGLER